MAHRTSVAARYPHVQGLRLLPLGLLFVVSAAWRAGAFRGWSSIDQAPRAWFYSGLLIAVVVSFPIRQWYRRRLGNGSPRRGGRGTVTLAIVAGAVLVTAAALPRAPGSVSLPPLILGLALAHPGLDAGRGRRHYLVLAAAWCLFACLPLLAVPMRVRDVGLDLLIGLSLIGAGLGDHWMLSRAFVDPHEASRVRTL
jgi:hypothetical protein